MNKKILLVDDSEIDRTILKSILGDEFEIIEAENGYVALEIIPKIIKELDAILLDVSMPILDGFSVLQLMKERKLDYVPIFLITAEATQDNVEKAAQYNVSEFLRKPFEREEILRRFRSRLGIVTKHDLTEADIKETNRYISDLGAVYKKYFSNFGKDNGHYIRIMNLMKIFLSKYAAAKKGVGLDRAQIEVISRAGYFCDIGDMLLPNNPRLRAVKQDELGNDIFQSHTILGADIIQLNRSKSCEYFVQVCSDICTHHHERYDGNGFPHRIHGSNLSINAQVCRLASEFDKLFYKYNERNEMRFDFVVSELAQDRGAVSEEVFSLLTGSKTNVLMYYNSKV